MTQKPGGNIIDYIVEKTDEFLACMPEINTANSYGSGFFTQGKKHKAQAMDLILSVNNPNNWHKENYKQNPWMYEGSGIKGLLNYAEDASFPKGLGAFFTKFQGRNYKLLVVDKRLLYNNLKTWQHFSLPGRFQKPMRVFIDNSDGVLPELMKYNYESAIKAAMLMSPVIPFEIKELYERIADLSYMGDVRRLFHFEDPNKTKNIVEGSYDFFEETYGKSDVFYRTGKHIFRTDISNLEIVDSLPENLKNYIHEELSHRDIRDPKKLSKRVSKYFRNLDLLDSAKMALRCNETVGLEKTADTLIGKAKKSMIKVRK